MFLKSDNYQANSTFQRGTPNYWYKGGKTFRPCAGIKSFYWLSFTSCYCSSDFRDFGWSMRSFLAKLCTCKGWFSCVAFHRNSSHVKNCDCQMIRESRIVIPSEFVLFHCRKQNFLICWEEVNAKTKKLSWKVLIKRHCHRGSLQACCNFKLSENVLWPKLKIWIHTLQTREQGHVTVNKSVISIIYIVAHTSPLCSSQILVVGVNP